VLRCKPIVEVVDQMRFLGHRIPKQPLTPPCGNDKNGICTVGKELDATFLDSYFMSDDCQIVWYGRFISSGKAE